MGAAGAEGALKSEVIAADRLGATEETDAPRMFELLGDFVGSSDFSGVEGGE